MADSSAQQKRRFSRIPFNAVAHINTEDGDQFLNCQVLDISLHGVLIERPGQWQADLHQPCYIDLLLQDGQVVIEMQAVVANIDAAYIGFECREIDLDSMTHLKRLVELNLGDEALLHRELSTLLEQA